MAEVIVKKGGCQIIKDSPSEYRLVKPGGLTIRCTSEAFAKEEMEKYLKKQESHGFSNGRAKALAVITNKAEAVGVKLGNARNASDELKMGYHACDRGEKITGNPFQPNTPSFHQWEKGFKECRAEAGPGYKQPK
jgi:hypothetical protein